MNQPYVKQFGSDGKVTNPITTSQPFKNYYPSRRGKSQNNRPANNRKITRGRMYEKAEIFKVLGFTVTAAQADEDGYKTKEQYHNFIEVMDPKYKYDRKKSTRQNRSLRLDAWAMAINAAEEKAVSVAETKDFYCHIIPKTQSTEILVRQN